MPNHHLSETFFRIELSLLLFELCRHEMLQLRWIILYMKFSNIVTIIMRQMLALLRFHFVPIPANAVYLFGLGLGLGLGLEL